MADPINALSELEKAMLDPVRTAESDGEKLSIRSADELIKLHQYALGQAMAAGSGGGFGPYRNRLSRTGC